MSEPISTTLLEDGALRLVVDAGCAAAVERWVPRFLAPPAAPSRDLPRPAVIRVVPGDSHSAEPAFPCGEPTIRLFDVRAWVDGARGTVRLAGGASGVTGSVDLTSRQAHIHAPASAGPEVEHDVFTMLTVTSAFLLGRLGRTLVHAAAVVAPAGGSWLLVGDTHAGKTTTTINLVRGGWSFLSDDHVVAGEGGDGVEIEGWPRPFHIDEGWERGEIAGRRAPIDPLCFGALRWRRTAPLRGLLFPRVAADEPTRLEPLSPGDALAALIRQTPWLLADPGAAPRVLEVLQRMVALPAFRLALGRDSYDDPALLLSRLHACILPDRGVPAPGRA